MWRRPKAELSEEDYKELYKSISGGWEDPLFWFHTKAEGSLEYTTLFYVPSKAPLDLYQSEYKGGVKLYVKGNIFIKPQFDIHYVTHLTDQFGRDWVPQYTVAVGYTFGER